MDTVNSILTYALNQLKGGQRESAEREFARAARACVDAFGENDIVTARTLAHVARICASQGKLNLAIPMYRRILCIHENLPLESNSDHAIALLELADVQAGNGAQEEADALCRRADEIVAELQTKMSQDEAGSDASGACGSSDEDDNGTSDDEEDEQTDEQGGSTPGSHEPSRVDADELLDFDTVDLVNAPNTPP